MILTASCQTVNLTGGASLARIYHSQQEYYSFISLIPRIFSVILRSCHGVEHFHHPWPRIKKKKKKKIIPHLLIPSCLPALFSLLPQAQSLVLLLLRSSFPHVLHPLPHFHDPFNPPWLQSRMDQKSWTQLEFFNMVGRLFPHQTRN